MQITQELKQGCSLLRNRVPAIFSMQMAHFHAGCHRPSGRFSCLADICAVYRHSPPPSPAHLYKDQPILSLRAGNPPLAVLQPCYISPGGELRAVQMGSADQPIFPESPYSPQQGGPNGVQIEWQDESSGAVGLSILANRSFGAIHNVHGAGWFS